MGRKAWQPNNETELHPQNQAWGSPHDLKKVIGGMAGVMLEPFIK